MNGSEFAVAWAVMKWPLVACLVLPPLLTYMGIHVVKREVIFVDLALAQVATFGTCIALIMGHDFHDPVTFWISLGVTFLGAALFSWSRAVEQHHVPQEATPTELPTLQLPTPNGTKRIRLGVGNCGLGNWQGEAS